MDSGLVCILIPNYNGWEDAEDCIRSLKDLEYADYRIVLLDNGSTDGSYGKLSAMSGDDPVVDVVAHDPNNGCAGGINAALAYAKRYEPAFYWFLNNDTTVDPAALTEMVATAAQHPEAGCFGSKIYYYDDPRVLWYAGGYIQRNHSGPGFHVGMGETDEGRYDSVRPLDFATGCSLMARAEVVEAIGGWSEDYYMYWEDIDWVARASRAGWQCLFVPTSVIWHKISRSFRGDTTLQRRYEVRSRLRFYWRNRRRSFVRVLFWMLASVLLSVARGESRTAKATLQGSLDFLLSRGGAIPSTGASTCESPRP